MDLDTSKYPFPTWVRYSLSDRRMTRRPIFAMGITPLIHSHNTTVAKSPHIKRCWQLTSSAWHGISKRRDSLILASCVSISLHCPSLCSTSGQTIWLIDKRSLQLTNPHAHKPAFKFATVPHGSTETNLMKNYWDMYQYMKPFNKSNVQDGVTAVKSGWGWTR